MRHATLGHAVVGKLCIAVSGFVCFRLVPSLLSCLFGNGLCVFVHASQTIHSPQ